MSNFRLVAVVSLVLCACGGNSRTRTTEVDLLVQVPVGAGVEGAGPEGGGAPADPPKQAPIRIAAGRAHTCALAADGLVYCWGDNRRDQLGDPQAEGEVLEPNIVPGIPPMTAIWAGFDATCARSREGAVFCWGRTHLAGMEPGVASPIPFEGVQGVALGQQGGCFWRGEDDVRCWRSRGNRRDDAAQRVHGLPAVEGVTVGMVRSCAVRIRDGAPICWGDRLPYIHFERLVDPTWTWPGVVDVSRVELPSMQNAFIHGRDGRVYELTRGAPISRNSSDARPALRAIEGLADARMFRTGGSHFCAITGDGTVGCWGRNTDGQLGDGTTRDRNRPVFTNLTGVEEIALGAAHTCARTSDRVFCWGKRNGPSGTRPARFETPTEVPW